MNYKECGKLLLSWNNILLISHKNPDGDTMGSCAALCSALRRSGKTVYLYPNSQVIKKLLPYVERFYAPEGFQAEHIVTVDIATPGLFPKGFEGAVDLCIDHHPTNTHYAAQELIRDEKSSCGEIILDLIKSFSQGLNQEEATLLYIAVTTDTGCFQYANVNARTLAAAAELLRLGADNRRVSLDFFRKVSAARIKLEGLLYESMSFYRNGKITVAIVTQDMMNKACATEDDCDDLAGLPGRAEGSVLSILIKETEEGGSKISLRSNPEVDSSAICAVFGGGGHAMAAGCNISCKPEKAREMLLAVIDEVWK